MNGMQESHDSDATGSSSDERDVKPMPKREDREATFAVRKCGKQPTPTPRFRPVNVPMRIVNVHLSSSRLMTKRVRMLIFKTT